jgi:hypothetical protein
VLDIPYLLSIHNIFNVSHRKKSSGERSGLRGGQGIGPPLPMQVSGTLSFINVSHKATETGRSSVLHKNNPTYSFLFEGFNLWNYVLFKYLEIDNQGNDALTEEGTKNIGRF